jgi:hypothetical protein
MSPRKEQIPSAAAARAYPIAALLPIASAV